MQIEWDAPITMDDGIVLRADVFRPEGDGRHPVILSYGPYAKGLSFQEGYKGNWARLTKAAPEVLQGSSTRYQNWELGGSLFLHRSGLVSLTPCRSPGAPV